jgi:redox-sensitive bicupin YhaK (pirin superfamily)
MDCLLILYYQASSTMKTIYHSASSRGYADHGWLQARHSFSFANYYNPERIHFGKLRVLNDDIVAPGRGFGTHPHDNMEIITIPLRGSLEHHDNMGNGSVISPGEVQVMSAGTGLTHSEYNPSDLTEVNLLQIWIYPEKMNVEPRYDQRRFDPAALTDNIRVIVNNKEDANSLFIHQKAVISLGKPSKGAELEYKAEYPGNGVYIFVIDGRIAIGQDFLSKRDALGVPEPGTIKIRTIEDAYVLFIEVPMN